MFFLKHCKIINQYFIANKSKFNTRNKIKRKIPCYWKYWFWTDLSQTEFSLKLELLDGIRELLNANNNCIYSINANKQIW